ncbi:MAG: hypothetical protein IPJ30_27720 [Acidobacteria bacterium]|nr:hypothetical protein [Acidobacteriota bacterium]MBK8147972.1 hypothetical protein [Acidobacteriota bacterium]
MLRRYMHARERHFVMLNDNRVVRPFEWGTEFVTDSDVVDPASFFADYSRAAIADSDAFFALPERIAYDDSHLKAGLRTLTWQSAIESPYAENNLVQAHFFPNEKDKKRAVVVLPHWNAKEGTYFDLCKVFRKVGISALRLTMPYHETRMPPPLERADYLVAPNVGQTLQSVRQAVLDTRAAVRWLKEQGFEKVGLVGTSIGSCVGFLSFVHDRNIEAGVFNHVSSYFADVVWKGLSTYHVKESIHKAVELEQLREYWLPISPAGYMEKLGKQSARPQRYIYTLYDLSFPIELSRQTLALLRENKIKHSRTALPCGHYTLGEKPWVYLDGYKIVSFLRKNLH